MEPCWLREQGPFCPDLLDYVQREKDCFDIFIFVTYLYYSIVAALPLVAEKSILVPTAYDERAIYFHMYRKIFTTPKGIIYLTGEENAFVEQLFHNSNIPNEVVGVDITPVNGEFPMNLWKATIWYIWGT